MKTELQKFIELHKGYSVRVDVREGNKTIITATFSENGSLVSHGRYTHLSQQSQEVLESLRDGSWDTSIFDKYILIASPDGEYFRHGVPSPLPKGFRVVQSASPDGKLLARFYAVAIYGVSKTGWKPKPYEIKKLGLDK